MKVSGLSLLIVTGIMWGAGLIMFLLPPIPGVPGESTQVYYHCYVSIQSCTNNTLCAVYLTMGIILPSQGYETLGMYLCFDEEVWDYCSHSLHSRRHRLAWVYFIFHC